MVILDQYGLFMSFHAGHQPPNNFYAWGDHEMNHLSWDYPLDAYSNAVRSVENNGNSRREYGSDCIS